MKNIIKIGFATISLLAMASCSEGYIDDISQVSAGEDKAAPVITINSPAAGTTTIPFTDTTSDFKFDYKVTDDIEIASVEILIDGVNQKKINNFLDYRIYSEIYTKNLGLGNHTFTVNAKDLTGKTATKSVTFNIDNKYTALYGEKAYFPFFAGNVFTDLLSGSNPSVMGSPKTATGGKSGAAYVGAADSYLQIPFTNSLYSNDNGVSLTFWYKVDPNQDRAGIITLGDESIANNDDSRKKGFRLFREGGSKTVKLNVGIGSGESWNDGFSIGSNTGWIHVAVTISKTESKIYLNGVLQRTATFATPFDFSNCAKLSIGSGAPTFTYWDHKSDTSMIDELRIYDKALDEATVKSTMQ